MSDLHYDLRKLDWVPPAPVTDRNGIDVAVVAGDLLDVASAVPLDTQITVVLSYLERLAAMCRPGLLRQSRSRPPHRVGREGHPLAGRGARQRCARRRRVVRPRRLELTACAWWEGRRPSPSSKPGLPSPRRIGPAGGCGRSTARPRARCHGPGARHYGDPSCPACSTRTVPTSCCVVTSTRRRSHPRAPGPNIAGRRGCSTPGYQRGDSPDVHRARPRR